MQIILKVQKFIEDGQAYFVATSDDLQTDRSIYYSIGGSNWVSYEYNG